MIEIKIHEVPRSHKYPDGLRWGLICLDKVVGIKVLMDNHHPKGPHFHLDEKELEYQFRGLDILIDDFRKMIREHMGVSI